MGTKPSKSWANRASWGSEREILRAGNDWRMSESFASSKLLFGQWLGGKLNNCQESTWIVAGGIRKVIDESVNRCSNELAWVSRERFRAGRWIHGSTKPTEMRAGRKRREAEIASALSKPVAPFRFKGMMPHYGTNGREAVCL